MSFCAFVVFTPFEFEDDDLRAAPVLQHGCGDARAGESWRSDSDTVIRSGGQNLVKFDCVAFLLISQSGDANYISRTHTKLFSACANDCISHYCAASDFLHIESRRLYASGGKCVNLSARESP